MMMITLRTCCVSNLSYLSLTWGWIIRSHPLGNMTLNIVWSQFSHFSTNKRLHSVLKGYFACDFFFLHKLLWYIKAKNNCNVNEHTVVQPRYFNNVSHGQNSSHLMQRLHFKWIGNHTADRGKIFARLFIALWKTDDLSVAYPATHPVHAGMGLLSPTVNDVFNNH